MAEELSWILNKIKPAKERVLVDSNKTERFYKELIIVEKNI